jgi:hypothetical protein
LSFLENNMINITDAATLASALRMSGDALLRRLLQLRHDQLVPNSDSQSDIGDLAHFIVVEPGDSTTTIETAAGYPVITEPAFDWVADHGGWYEAVTILSDDGFAVALFVPERKGVNRSLLKLLRDLAAPAPMQHGDVQQGDSQLSR